MIGRLGFAAPGCMVRVNNPGFKATPQQLADMFKEVSLQELEDIQDFNI